jgi:hypothetical protein
MGDKSMFTMGFSKNQLGCCGYDELAVKPATTSPITNSKRIPQVNMVKSQLAAPPRAGSIGTTSRVQIQNLQGPREGLLQKGRREGRS